MNLVALNEQLKNIRDQLNGATNALNSALNNLKDLENQVPVADKNLNAAYLAGNDANTRVQDCRANLDALVCKLETDTNALVEATNNL